MVVESVKNTSFFYTCKENYYLGILPTNPQSQEMQGYKVLVSIAQTYFEAGLYEPILQYLSEKRYQMQIWAAYLTLNYGEPEEELRADCLQILSLASNLHV